MTYSQSREINTFRRRKATPAIGDMFLICIYVLPNVNMICIFKSNMI